MGDFFRGSIVGRAARRHFYICDLPSNDADVRTLLEGPAKDVDLFFVNMAQLFVEPSSRPLTNTLTPKEPRPET